MQQFQSDRYLFSFLGIIVLIVACSNIISFLILLVQDKKREIGILQALGASKKSIAIIFGGCGAVHRACQQLYWYRRGISDSQKPRFDRQIFKLPPGARCVQRRIYGSSLPSEMSVSALVFVAIITPIFRLSQD